MKLLEVRRAFFDGNHNAFTDICHFKGDYYLTFRTSTRHIAADGRALVLRGLDGGRRWLVVGSVYSGIDTRDPKFMIKDDKLFLYTFSFRYGENRTRFKVSGYSVTSDGNFWSPWQEIEKDWVYWHPAWFKGRAYVIAYREADAKIMLKMSEDGVRWEDVCIVSEDATPNETSLVFKEDGTAYALIRREAGKFAFLSRSSPPYREWQHTELDMRLSGPLLWFVGDELWACGRWELPSSYVHTAAARIEGNRAIPQVVLPSAGDTSYAGIVKKPDSPNRYLLSYYSEHESLTDWRPEGPMPSGIYLAELELP